MVFEEAIKTKIVGLRSFHQKFNAKNKSALANLQGLLFLIAIRDKKYVDGFHKIEKAIQRKNIERRRQHKNKESILDSFLFC